VSESVIEVKGFHKTYGDFVAVDGISFAVERGEIFGLLGPNGAGKTTTLESLEGLRVPDQGEMRILGIDPTRQIRKLRHLIGVQLQTSGLPASMTVGEAMAFFCAYHGLAPRTDVLGRLGLGEKTRAQYRELSAGQQRRLALALSIAHNPPVVILDEPTAGLDVASRVELHAIMQELQKSGVTLILATHDMAEAEKLADRVAILLRGRIVATGTPRDLTATGAGTTKISVRSEGSSLQVVSFSFPAVTQQTTKDDYVVYYSTDPGASVSAILHAIEEQHDHLIDLRVERPSLEERFLEITDGGSHGDSQGGSR
jgi:ABC-2 type transport system ATP-binding protein